MEKVKEIIKKNENISVILLILLMIIGFCTNVVILSCDEIWNFQNICKMLNGYKIYTDANVITTPLFHFLGYILLKVFGQNLLVFRIYNIIIMTTMYFFIYKILQKLCKNKFFAFTYFILIMIQSINYFCVNGANYNTLAMVFVLLGVYLNLIWIEKDEKHNIIQGIIMFFVFFTKQNIGAFYIVGIIAYNLIKEKNIKNTIKQITTVLILIFITMLVFVYFDIFYDFINYAILGIREFAKENIKGEIINIVQTIFFIIFIFLANYLLIGIKKIQSKEKNRLILLSTTSILLLLIGFPIYDHYHTLVGSVLTFVFIAYVLDDMIFSKLVFNKSKMYIKIILLLFILVYFYMSLINFISWTHRILQNDNYESPFFGGNMRIEDSRKFDNVMNYITHSKENVIILTDDAALYMIPLKRSNGAMDLAYLGNMGKDGENEMINKIRKMKNTIFLIKKDEKKLSWQESEKINRYIKKNFEYLGDIEKFSIYKNNL